MATRDQASFSVQARLSLDGRSLSSLERSLLRIGAVAAGVLALLTTLWILLLVLAPAPPSGATPEETLAFVAQHDGWQVLSFGLVAPIALLQIPLWLALAAFLWSSRPALSLLVPAIGILYAPFTIWAYWSQISVVRGLADLYQTAPADAVAAFRVLNFTSDSWSVAYASDVLGYVIWGIAALLVAFGLISSSDRLVRLTASLFGLAGALTVVWLIGFIGRIGSLDSAGALGSGAVFLLAAIASSAMLWQASEEKSFATASSDTG